MKLQTEAQYRQELATCWQMIEQDRDEIKSLRQQLAAMTAAYTNVTERIHAVGGYLDQLVAALVAIKAKDEVLRKFITDSSYDADYPPPYAEGAKALAIQPDDSALKAWLGEPRSYLYKFNSEFGDGTFWSHRPTHNGQNALESIPLYAPKGLNHGN